MTALLYRPDMAVMTIRGLDDEVRDKLRLRAAQHGRSMEAEVRRSSPRQSSRLVERRLIDALLQMREALGGLELEIPPRADYARDPFA